MNRGQETPAESPKGGWHLKRELQIAHLLATLTLAVSGLNYLATQRERVTVLEHKLESQIALQRERDSAQDRAVAEKTSDMGRQLERVEQKLDRLIERVEVKLERLAQGGRR